MSTDGLYTMGLPSEEKLNKGCNHAFKLLLFIGLVLILIGVGIGFIIFGK